MSRKKKAAQRTSATTALQEVSASLGTWGKIVIGLLLLMAFILAFHTIHSLDIGFHLKAGDWILENFSFPGKDVFTYTVNQQEYIDLYWLYQVVLSIFNGIGGEFGLVFMNALLIVAGLVIALYRVRQLNSASLYALPLVLFAGILASSYYYAIRPHVFSWIYLGLILFVLQGYYRDKSSKLYLLPVIMLLWANTHTLFILGWVAMFCYGAGMLVEEKKVDMNFLKWSGLAVLICLINPYFFEGVLLPFQQYGFLQEGSLFKSLITEYESPIFDSFYVDRLMHEGSLILITPFIGFFLYLLLSIAGMVLSADRRKVHEWLLFILFGIIMAMGMKNIGYFIIATMPIVVDGFNIRSGWLWKGKGEGDRRRFMPVGDGAQLWINSLVGVVAVITVLRVMTNAYYIDWGARVEFGYHYNSNVIPVKAAEFLRGNKLEGRLLNHINFGGSLMYFLPQQVFIDARNEVIGEEFLAEYLKLNSPKTRNDVLAAYKPDIAVFPHRTAKAWLKLFRADKRWRLVYYDDVAAIYLRNGYADNIAAVDGSFQLQNVPKRSAEEMVAIIEEQKRMGFLGSLFSSQYYPNPEIDVSSFVAGSGWVDDAIAIGVDGLARSTVNSLALYHNLGLFYTAKKRYKAARYCYARYAEEIESPNVEKRIRDLTILMEREKKKQAQKQTQSGAGAK